MKRIMLLFWIILLLIICIAFADCDRVIIVNFNYDNQLITYKGQAAKCGFYPDRRLQPSSGYRAEMVGEEGVQYSFRFDIPLKLYVDASDPSTKELSGGIILLNQTDFALIFPYLDAKEIVIYNPRGYEVERVPLEAELFAKEKGAYWIILFFILLALAIYLVFRHYRPAKTL
jgi:hypothetical protein